MNRKVESEDEFVKRLGRRLAAEVEAAETEARAKKAKPTSYLVEVLGFVGILSVVVLAFFAFRTLAYPCDAGVRCNFLGQCWCLP